MDTHHTADRSRSQTRPASRAQTTPDPREQSTSSTRAQTTLDFAIAMGIFLLTIAFVFSFIPALTAPFVEGDQDGSVTGDRIASHLAEGGLGDPNEPYVVNVTCANVFFNGSTQAYHHVPDGCGYNGTGLHERVGVSDRHKVAVQLLHVDPDAVGAARYRPVCVTDLGNITHTGIDNCQDDGDVLYDTGGEVGNYRSVTVTRRVVTVPDCEFGTGACDVTLRVKVS